MTKQKKKTKVSKEIFFNEYNHGNEIECPYCHHVNYIDLELALELMNIDGFVIGLKESAYKKQENNEVKCEKCGKTLIVTISINFTGEDSWHI